MKKVYIIILLLIICFALTIAAWAEEIYADIAELWNENWGMGDLPDWVCSVSSTDGSMERMTVIVNSEEAEQELLSMLADPSTLTVIVSATAYTEQDLAQIHREIVDVYMSETDPVVHSCGVGWTIIDGEVTGFGESGKENRVVVGVLPEYVEEYTALFREKYGDMVYVEGRDRLVEETAAAVVRPVWPIFAGTAIALAAACLIIGKRRAAWKKTA